MGLNKIVDLSGNNYQYHRIITVADDKAKNQAQILLALYKDKAYRDANPDGFVRTRTYAWADADPSLPDYPLDLTELAKAGVDHYTIFYNELKIIDSGYTDA